MILFLINLLLLEIIALLPRHLCMTKFMYSFPKKKAVLKFHVQGTSNFFTVFLPQSASWWHEQGITDMLLDKSSSRHVLQSALEGNSDTR